VKRFFPAIIAFAAGVLVAVVFLRGGKGVTTPEAHAHEAASTNGPGVVEISAEKQQQAGIVTAMLQQTNLFREEQVPGRILDVSALALAVSERTLARAAAEASRRDYERVRLLHDQKQNASTRALELAEATLQRDTLASAAAQVKIAAAWGGAFARRDDLETLTTSLANQSNALVRVDFPLGTSVPTNLDQVTITPPSSGMPTSSARLMGPLPAVDPQSQGASYVFIITNGSVSWPSGALVTAHVRIGNQAEAGWWLPPSAVVRFQSGAWIYSKRGEDKFVREPVPTEWPIQNGWFVQSGISSSNQVVVQGAAAVLSEELTSSASAPAPRD
jgi:hypothetical protein